MNIKQDVLELTAVFPVMMKYSDVCDALNISDKYLYKMLENKRIVYINLIRGKRIPRAFFVAYLVKDDSIRNIRFIKKVYTYILSIYPKKMTINEVCQVLNISKSTVKRMLADGELSSIHYHDTASIQISKDSLMHYMIEHTVK